MDKSNNKTIKVIIGGDVCPVERNEPFFCAGDPQEILHDLLPVWMGADLRMVNLECPFVESPSPIRKTGPNLGVHPNVINGLKGMKIDVVGLANNHTLDHGSDALLKTIRLYRESEIDTLGAGANLNDASEFLVRNIQGVRLGIIAMADLEWSIAGRHSAGANPFSMPGFLKVMRRLRSECDYIVALMHMGKEHYPYPSPRLQEVCRCMVDEGVSIVVCQHSHCVGANEHYGNGFISYGQGNLIFDSPKSRRQSWRTGHLLEVSFSPDAQPVVKSIPYIQRSDGRGVDSLAPPEADAFRAQMKIMEREIQDIEFVERKWAEFCAGQRDLYLSLLAGQGRWRRKFNELTGVTTRLYSSEAIAVLENIIRCEAHQEVLLGVLRDLRCARWGE